MYLKRLIEIVNDNNKEEIIKLIDFLSYQYQKEIVHIENELLTLDDIYQGIYYVTDKKVNEKDLLNKFIELKLTEIQKNSVKQKQLA